MKSVLDQADENRRTGRTLACKVKEAPQIEGKVVFTQKNGQSQMTVANSPRGYTRHQLNGFADKVQKLQSEGRLSSSGSVAISTLEKL